MSDGQTTDLLTEGAGETLTEPTGDAGNPKSGGPDASQESVASATDGNNVPALHKQFEQDLKGHESLLKFDTASKLARAYVDLEQQQGNTVSLPGENATDEELSRFFERIAPVLGRPETQDGYQFDDVELPEGVELTWVDGELKSFAEQAFGLKLSQEQANELQKWFRGQTANYVKTLGEQRVAARDTALAEAERKLKSDWGSDYNKHKELANRTIARFPEFSKFVVDNELQTRPELRRFFADLGAQISEGEGPRSDGEGSSQPGESSFPHLADYEKNRQQGTF